MNEPSKPLNTALPTDGQESSPSIEQAQKHLDQLRKTALANSSEPRYVGAKYPKTSRSEPNAQRQRARREAHLAYLRDREVQRKRESIDRRWKDAQVPQRHADSVDLREYATGGWLNAYCDLRSRLESGVLAALLGKRGTGKTQMAVCLIRDCCESGGAARYVKAMDLFAIMRQGMRDGDELAAMKQWRKPALLVIDEAHERGETDYENRMLANLVDHRYDALKSTLLLSNLNRETFANSVSTSIVSRIHETGVVVDCQWDSFREQGRDRHE